MNERERGERDEERCILIGERVELVGEARLRGGNLVLQEPQVSSAQLHRVNSSMIGDSTLQGKKFLAAVIRGQRSLADLQIGRAVWYRVGKWLSGSIFVFIMMA